MGGREEATKLVDAGPGGPLGHAEEWGPCAPGTEDALELSELANDVTRSVFGKASLGEWGESTGVRRGWCQEGQSKRLVIISGFEIHQ